MQREGLARNGLHLAALSSFAIAQQYFEPLADGPDFFIEQGATGTDVALFAIGLVLVPLALLVVAEALAGLVDERARDVLHLAFVGGLVALIAWQAITEASPGVASRLAYLAAFVVGLGGAFAYARVAVVRTWLTVLSVAPVVVLVLFLVLSPARTLAFGGGGPEAEPRGSSGAPVVMVVLDELPLASLLDSHNRIDATRYPGFAALARDSTWYRNAASVADYTQLAVPSMLTGNPAKPGTLQVASEHPDNLFTLLGGSYRLDVFEALTDLCQTACERQLREPFQRRMRDLVSTAVDRVPALPPPVRRRVADAVAVEGPPEDAQRSRRFPEESVRRFLSTTQDVRFERFLDTLAPEPRTLNFMHLVLPHRPWRYLPSGQRYESRRSYREGLFGRWPRDRRVVEIAWQRHLLQVGLVDRMLIRLIRRMRAIGTYDRSLLVVVADHGASFRPGDHSRIVTTTNTSDIASVPFFVKTPRQGRGGVDDSWVLTTDVLPTIARHLRVRVPWKTQGRPAGEAGRAGRTDVEVLRQDDGGSVTIARSELERERARTVRRRIAAFRRGLFALGPRPGLLGRRVERLPRGVRVTLDSPERFRSVDPGAGTLPVDVTGEVHTSRVRSRPIAVAVNGRVAATAWTLASGDLEYFTALVPPSALQRGRNRVEVRAVP